MKTMASIFCTAFNHEKYIKRALDSFLMQETNFPYEVIIHDDASTDETRDIISDYEKQYPDIIKPIYQEVNQYSQGIPIYELFMYPKANGKYFAICEGDDYWTDFSKLQKQVDFMESYPTYSLCMHGAVRVRARDEKEIGPYSASLTEGDFSTEELITMEDSFSTNSMLYLAKHMVNLPEFVYKGRVGDYPLTIYLSLKGKVHYMADTMSAYRNLSDNSWTKQLLETPGAIEEHYKDMEKLLHEIDAYTHYKYSDIIHTHILENKLVMNQSLYNLKGAKSEELKIVYKELSIIKKAKLYLGYYIPFSVKLSHFIRQYGQ